MIFFQQHTFFIVYILLYNSILNWFSLTLQSLNIIDFFRMLNIFSLELHPLLVQGPGELLPSLGVRRL